MKTRDGNSCDREVRRSSRRALAEPSGTGEADPWAATCGASRVLQEEGLEGKGSLTFGVQGQYHHHHRHAVSLHPGAPGCTVSASASDKRDAHNPSTWGPQRKARV